jgi:hypothetical protein
LHRLTEEPSPAGDAGRHRTDETVALMADILGGGRSTSRLLEQAVLRRLIAKGGRQQTRSLPGYVVANS